jgi:hypothetical protein
MDEQKPKAKQGIPLKKKRPVLLILIIIILIIAVGGLIINLLDTKSELTTLQSEKEQQRVELQTELDLVISEHNKIKEDYGTLSDSLFIKDSIIQENASEIKKLLNTKWEYYKIKKKLKLLQGVAQGYVHQMDSLYNVNKALTEENIRIKEEFSYELKLNSELTRVAEDLSEMVEQASVLKAYNTTAVPMRLKSNGKETPTDKARRLEKIKICFTLSENLIIPEGVKTLYVRIARPDKLILVKNKSDDYSFTFQGETLQYSMKEDIEYNNIQKDICLSWIKRYSKEPMMTGVYNVEIFSEDEVIGNAQFTLK